jgi:hypothetical protein
MILEANTHVLASLRKFYERLLKNPDFPLKTTCREDVLVFASRIEEIIYDLKMQIARAKLLVQITSDRRNLVSRNHSFVKSLFSNVSLLRYILMSNRCFSNFRAKRQRKWRL